MLLVSQTFLITINSAYPHTIILHAFPERIAHGLERLVRSVFRNGTRRWSWLLDSQHISNHEALVVRIARYLLAFCCFQMTIENSFSTFRPRSVLLKGKKCKPKPDDEHEHFMLHDWAESLTTYCSVLFISFFSYFIGYICLPSLSKSTGKGRKRSKRF